MRFLGSVFVGATVFYLVLIFTHAVGLPRVVGLSAGGVACFLTIIWVHKLGRNGGT